MTNAISDTTLSADVIKAFAARLSADTLRIEYASMVHDVDGGTHARRCRRRARGRFGHQCHPIGTSGTRYLRPSSARQRRSAAGGLCAADVDRAAGSPATAHLFTRTARSCEELAQALPGV